jgi:outer membrane lipoprotein LolB
MVPTRRPDPGRLALLVLLAALGGCHTLARTAVDLPWPERCAALTASTQYRFSGRIAARSGNTGFSAGIDWQQRGAQSEATLRGPLGVGTVRVSIDPDGVSVQDGSGQRISGDAGVDRLREVLGFDPPLTELRYWLLACSAPGAPADEQPDAAQHLAALQQSGWQLEFSQYQNTAPYVLPVRIRARHGVDSLQLAISRWRLP